MGFFLTVIILFGCISTSAMDKYLRERVEAQK